MALLEFGIFEEDDGSAAPSRTDSGCSPPQNWTPERGVGKSPLMHLAYHIKDDRYEHVDDTKMTAPSPTTQEDANDDEDDAYDTNAWISTVRSACEHLDQPLNSLTPAALVVNDDLPDASLSNGQFSRRPNGEPTNMVKNLW